MTRRDKRPGPGAPAPDIEALVAAVGRFDINNAEDLNKTGGFVPWDSLMRLDADRLLTALLENRVSALAVLRVSGFNSPLPANAITDPKAARRLAKAVYDWLDGYKQKSSIHSALASITADILWDWCTIIAPRTASWERETAVVRILGAGAYCAFLRRDAALISRAARDAEQTRLERVSKSEGGKQGGIESGISRQAGARARKQAFLKADANSKLSAAAAARKHGLSERTVRRWRDEKRPARR